MLEGDGVGAVQGRSSLAKVNALFCAEKCFSSCEHLGCFSSVAASIDSSDTVRHPVFVVASMIWVLGKHVKRSYRGERLW